MKSLALRLTLLTLLALSGCNRLDTSDALPLGSHKVSVRPRCASKQISNRFPDGNKIYNLTCGDTRVTIRNEELTVNDKPYGVLKEGDSVHVEDGRVYVNLRQVEEAHR